jgi:hypothetical protein
MSNYRPERGVQIENESVIKPSIATQPVVNFDCSEFANLPPELAARAAKLRDFLKESQSTVQLNSRWGRAETAALREQIGIAHAPTLDILADVFDKRHVVLTELEESSQSGE